MNAIVSRMIGAGLFFLLIFLSGFWLSRSGKPYPVIVFTVHKLLAIGAVIFLVVIVNQAHRAAPLQTIQVLGAAITALFLIATIVTGGLVSLEKPMPAFLLRLHQINPYMSVVSTGVLLYLVLVWGRQMMTASH